MAEFQLLGLDGGNPLAFLAAMGALRISDQAWPERRPLLAWDGASGSWRPMLTLTGDMARDEWLAGLDQTLREPAGQQAFKLADDLTIACSAFAAAARRAREMATSRDRREVDFLAGFGNEMVESEVNGKKTGQIADTALRTMSGAGHQHFLGFMRALAADTSLEHLSKACFTSWQYDDPVENHTLRWDPVDDVRYALRWRNSSGDSERKRGGTVWGANRLAIEALPLLPTAPFNSRLETTGFTQRKGEGTLWSWPIWNTPISLNALRSLLALHELTLPVPDRTRLAAMGVIEVYRSQRITQGKYRNFTPARPA